MSVQTTNRTAASDQRLSEKARRLLAAHDREVDRTEQSSSSDWEIQAYRLAG